jgi:hypothetical protein
MTRSGRYEGNTAVGLAAATRFVPPSGGDDRRANSTTTINTKSSGAARSNLTRTGDRTPIS